MTYDLIIIGAGPAGVAAGVYAARKKLTTLLITYDFGGQSTVSPDIQNWIGTPSISGNDLAKNLENHLRQYEGQLLTIKTGQKVDQVTKTDDEFTITTDSGEQYTGQAVILACGASRRKLNVPGAEQFDQKGLTYCASCDGPMFADKDVAVIGGGNAGFETAAQLLAYCKSVTLLHNSEEFKADKITVEKVLKHPQMTAITNTQTIEVKGDKFVTGLVYQNKQTGEKHDLAVEGIFVEIGLVPNTAMVKDLIDLNQYQMVVTDPKNQQTSVPGIWAAGDCTDSLYHQNNIAAGDAVRALEDIYVWLKTKK